MTPAEDRKAVRQIGKLMRGGAHVPSWSSQLAWVDLMDAVARQHGMSLLKVFSLIAAYEGADDGE